MEIIKECTHYDKKCSHFKFNCCNDQKIDNCHRCHIERKFEENLGLNKKSCDKPKIYSIVCDECQTEQIPSNKCINCNINFSKNYCDECKLWTMKDITHCFDCDLCRIGLPGTLEHCDSCGICFNSNNFKHHKCCNNLLIRKEDCSICLQSLFNTQNYTSCILNCGHAIHSQCLESCLKTTYKCPLCRKSMIDMSNYWNQLKNQIKITPIQYFFRKGMTVSTPYGKLVIADIFSNKSEQILEEISDNHNIDDYNIRGQLINFKTIKPTFGSFSAKYILTEYLKCTIICVDCEKESIGNRHDIGIQCKFCDSFNTIKK